MLLNFLMFLSTVSFHPEAAQADDLRIFCKNSSPGLQTLLSSSSENYPTSTIDFFDQNGKELYKIHDYQPLSSNALHSDVIVLSEDRKGQVTLYRAGVHFGTRRAESLALFGSRSLSPETSLTLTTRGLSTRLLALKDFELLAPAPNATDWVLYDIRSRQFKSMKLEQGLLNPRFSTTSNAIIFDRLDPKTSQLQQVAYDPKTLEKVLSAQNPQLNVLFAEFHPQRNSWLTWEVSSDRSQAALIEIKDGKRYVLYKAEDRSLYFPVSYAQSPEGLKVYWPEHKYQMKYDEDSRPLGLEFSKAEVKTLALTKNQSVFSAQPYSEKILEKVRHGDFVLSLDFMSSSFISPNRQEMIFSMGPTNGLAKLNLRTGDWTLHGTVMSQCLSPRWTLEGEL